MVLQENGYDVEVLGGWMDAALKARDIQTYGKGEVSLSATAQSDRACCLAILATGLWEGVPR